MLQKAGLSTLLIDLLTIDEERVDDYTAHLRFDTRCWLRGLQALQTGLSIIRKHSTSTSAISELRYWSRSGAAAATKHPDVVNAIVSRGGRPDLAGSSLPDVKAPTLLIVGDDATVIELNEQAREQMRTECKIVIVPGASHLFEEPGKLEEVARLATDWFLRHLTKEVKDDPLGHNR